MAGASPTSPISKLAQPSGRRLPRPWLKSSSVPRLRGWKQPELQGSESSLLSKAPRRIRHRLAKSRSPELFRQWIGALRLAQTDLRCPFAVPRLACLEVRDGR